MKKNGFTMIELLAVIVLFATISVIGLTSFDFTKNIGDYQKNKEKNENLKKAYTTYYQQLYKNNKLKYYKLDDKLEFCIDYNNLVSNGYLNEEDVPLKNGTTSYKFLKITAESKNAEDELKADLNYKYTTKDTNDEEECKKIKYNIATAGNIENSNYNFVVSISQVTATTYDVNLIYRMKIINATDSYKKILVKFISSEDFKYIKDGVTASSSIDLAIIGNFVEIAKIEYGGMIQGNFKFKLQIKKNNEINVTKNLFKKITIENYENENDTSPKTSTNINDNFIPKVNITTYKETLIN